MFNSFDSFFIIDSAIPVITCIYCYKEDVEEVCEVKDKDRRPKTGDRRQKTGDGIRNSEFSRKMKRIGM